jgi:hypothetical protein
LSQERAREETADGNKGETSMLTAIFISLIKIKRTSNVCEKYYRSILEDENVRKCCITSYSLCILNSSWNK